MNLPLNLPLNLLFHFALAVSFLPQTSANPSASERTEPDLIEFERDSRTFIEHQNAVEESCHDGCGFGDRVDRAEVLAARNESRDAILAARTSSPAKIGQKSQQKLEELIDPAELVATNGRILRNLDEIARLGYASAELKNDVWSGSIWNQYRGHTGWRYSLPSPVRLSSWRDAWLFISTLGHTYFDVATESPAWRPDRAGLAENLSPAEKYDLIVSSALESPQGHLSRSEWKKGEEREAASGKVAKWYGYCHGWAPASFGSARPLSSIDVSRADGNGVVRFFPDDLKALITALWANALPPLRVIGERCNESDPPRDENGRVISDKCRDVNPGVFHLALVNQLGVAGRNLLIDATYDQQVWNQPVTSYRYSYFNPQTKKPALTVSEATIPISQFSKDKFKRYRSIEAQSVVGVLLEIEFAKSIPPSQLPDESAATNARAKAKFIYDLEVNAAGEVIGGEWYQLRHPDFIWTTANGARATSRFDAGLKGPWLSDQQVPVLWREPAQKAALLGQPLAAIVETLVERSRTARE